jgi:tryptophanyl-tRNA synthetase
MTKPRILSGVQPTGNLHLGNYLGAIRNWVGLQDSHECLFMLADLHAITVPQDPTDLTRNTRETAAAYIACGIDPKKSIIFPQSAVSMHAELAWILNCHTPLGWLNRMTQFKEKAGLQARSAESVLADLKRDQEELKTLLDAKIQEVMAKNTSQEFERTKFNGVISSSVESAQTAIEYIESESKTAEKSKLGLYAYPVLMAADIIGYHATHVPVGADQKQHLELARDIAGAFNRAYEEEFFPLPAPIILPTAARIMSLTDGTKKMSKSDPSDYSRITLTDDADAIANKIKKAQTDSEPSLSYDATNRPSVANLLSIYAALSGSTPEAVAEQFAALKTGQFKAQLAELAVEKFAPITARMRELMADTASLDAILRDGAQKARAIAEPILAETKKRVGFLRV